MQHINNSMNDLNIIEDKVSQLIDSVISGIHQDWPTLYKIRYIYLGIGKHLYKDTDFFFSADGKLGEANLSIPQIKDIYDNELGRMVRSKLKVICRSASYILKMAYDRAGIDSKLIETNTTITANVGGEEFLINHWLLAINDDDGKIYFATLTPDLPYIQMNMDTRHFGSDIPYKREFNGKFMQIYKGDRIKHSVIPREKLKVIDIAIGYINKSYHYNDKAQSDDKWFLQYDNAALYMLRDSLRDNKLFYELEIIETPFYQSLMNFGVSNGKKFSFVDDNINSLTNNDWNCWLKILCGHILKKIEEILGYEINVLPNIDGKHWNYESWLLNLCTQVQYDLFLRLNNGVRDNFSDISINVENFKYNKWSKKVKSKFGKPDKRFEYDNILVILDKMNALVNCVKSNLKNGNFNNLFSSLSYHFINKNHLYENNISEEGYLSNFYIANKIYKIFPKVFSCNESVTEFNQMGYSEKISIIKDIVEMMFPEITKNNSLLLKEYNNNYSAVLNRIQMYPIKNRNDGYYSILFNILGDDNNSDYYFLYNAKKNTFYMSNALNVYSDYIIISNRMKDRMGNNKMVSIEDLEKIDEVEYDELEEYCKYHKKR